MLRLSDAARQPPLVGPGGCLGPPRGSKDGLGNPDPIPDRADGTTPVFPLVKSSRELRRSVFRPVELFVSGLWRGVRVSLCGDEVT